MSFDDRLRRELNRTADTIEPDVGEALAVVEGRTRRRGTIGLGSVLAGVAVVLVVVVVRSVRPLGSPPYSSYAPRDFHTTY